MLHQLDHVYRLTRTILLRSLGVLSLGTKASGSTQETLSNVVLDVTDEESIKAAAVCVQQRFCRLDVLVNNATVAGTAINNMKTRLRGCLDTNVIGPVVVSELFRPLLLKSQNPNSIYVSSGARTLARNAIQRPPYYLHVKHVDAYQVSKAALNMLPITKARDYGPDGLKVFALSPGFVRSNIRGPSEEEISGWGQTGDPEDAGGIVLDIIKGKREADIGHLIHQDGIYDW